MILLALYLTAFILAWAIVGRKKPQTAVTVSFGDAAAVRPNRIASALSVLVLFAIWGAFTGSALFPLHVPGPFRGETGFTYTAEAPDGSRDDAKVSVLVHPLEEKPVPQPAPESGSGFAQDDAAAVPVWRSGLVKVSENDLVPGARIVAIDGQPIQPGETVAVADGSVALTAKGTISFSPDRGYQMEPIWLPSPEAVWARLLQVASDGYQNTPLWEHLGYSLFRVLAGFATGAAIGIPLGYAMGLSGWFRGWFDPIVEFMRPVPPLALIPLIIIWFGIWETGKIVLLFLAALWIMTISARAGVTGVRLSKVHAAYSLGASRWQVLTRVIVPNSLPEIFTGARVAMGVCWGTVVAAELVAAQKGAGMMIIAASKFQQTDVVVMGIILIGLVGYGIDILMRKAEAALVPWKGRG